ncbi:MAG: GFA family protein [Desulfuromonadales bacterium]|nr:GFA family protein [Desulfuromonadales bacterium]
MSEGQSYRGSCFCGDVEFILSGEPAVMAYCHCSSCRQWSAGPLNAFTLWPPESFRIVQGAEQVSGFDKSAATGQGAGMSNRKWCRNCGGHVYIDHPAMGVVDVPAVLIQGFSFDPAFHVHYQETVHPMKDGLAKFADLPSEAGGTGEQLPE